MLPDIARIARIPRSRALGLGFGILAAITTTGLALASTQDTERSENHWWREDTVPSMAYRYEQELDSLGRRFEVHAKYSKGLFSRAKSTAGREVASELYRISSSTSGVIAHIDDLYHLGANMKTEADRVLVLGYLHARVVRAIELLGKSVEQIDHEIADVQSDDVVVERGAIRKELQRAIELLQSLHH